MGQCCGHRLWIMAVVMIAGVLCTTGLGALGASSADVSRLEIERRAQFEALLDRHMGTKRLAGDLRTLVPYVNWQVVYSRYEGCSNPGVVDTFTETWVDIWDNNGAPHVCIGDSLVWVNNELLPELAFPGSTCLYLRAGFEYPFCSEFVLSILANSVTPEIACTLSSACNDIEVTWPHPCDTVRSDQTFIVLWTAFNEGEVLLSMDGPPVGTGQSLLVPDTGAIEIPPSWFQTSTGGTISLGAMRVVQGECGIPNAETFVSAYTCHNIEIEYRYMPPPCDCSNQCDYDDDGFQTTLDIAWLIDVLYAGTPEAGDPPCPVSRGDFNNDGFPDALDLSWLIDYVFGGGPPMCNPCDPIQSSCVQ